MAQNKNLIKRHTVRKQSKKKKKETSRPTGSNSVAYIIQWPEKNSYDKTQKHVMWACFL